MLRSAFVIRDPSVRPAGGQQIMLEHGGYRTRGVVVSCIGDSLRVRPESYLFLRQLRPGARIKSQVMTRDGTLEVTVGMVNCHEDDVVLQLIGQPRLLQRRGHPRVAVRVDATLSWLVPRSGVLLQVEGRTQNLSMGGALIRFPQVPDRLPKDEAVTLLGLWIPDGQSRVAVSVAVHAVHVWETGARLRFVDLGPEARDLLGGYLEPRLA